MLRIPVPALSSVVLRCGAALAGGCGSAKGRVAGRQAGEAAAVPVATAAAVEQPITRFIRVSGTLTAQEEAEVAAEIAGRVVATPVERGSRVARRRAS